MHAVIKLPPLLFHLSLPVGVGVLSAFLSGNRAVAYAALLLPAYAMPLAAFDAAWALAFGCLGGSAYLILASKRLRRQERGACMGLYGLLLLAGALWSLLFFRFRFYSFAAWWSVLLLAVALLVCALFFRIRRKSALLFIPCGVWLLYVALLSFAVAALN